MYAIQGCNKRIANVSFLGPVLLIEVSVFQGVRISGFGTSTVLSFRFYFSTHCDFLQVFTDWSKKVNEQFMSQQRNCLMLLDNAGSHGVADTLLTKVGSLDAFRLSNLLLLFLPPNCTSVVQPLDQGIIAAFKSHYKGKLARYMVQ